MSSSKYTSDEKIHMMEQLIPQLEQLLPIVRKSAANLLNKGTVDSGKRRLYSRNGNTYFEGLCLHMDKPDASYRFIEIGVAGREAKLHQLYKVQYIKWNKAGADYSIVWRIDPEASRRKTITEKFWFFRRKKEVVQFFREIWTFEFDFRHNDDNLSFRMEYEDRERMSIDSHTKLCDILVPYNDQFELVRNYTFEESKRLKNEEKLKTMRHFEKLMNPSDTPK